MESLTQLSSTRGFFLGLDISGLIMRRRAQLCYVAGGLVAGGRWPVARDGDGNGGRWPLPVAGGRWPVAGGRWSVVDGRWPVAGVRWPVAGGRWPVAGDIK